MNFCRIGIILPNHFLSYKIVGCVRCGVKKTVLQKIKNCPTKSKGMLVLQKNAILQKYRNKILSYKNIEIEYYPTKREGGFRPPNYPTNYYPTNYFRLTVTLLINESWSILVSYPTNISFIISFSSVIFSCTEIM